MFRPIAAAAAFAVFALGGAASAQTYGQPIYLNAYGRPVGGSPLSEVETRSYVETGRWADGSSDRPQVYVPAPGYGRPYTQYGSSYRYPDHRSAGYGSGYGRRSGDGYGYPYGGRYEARPRQGYRDEWGYDDDRPQSAWRARTDRSGRYRDDRACGCADVYFYDR